KGEDVHRSIGECGLVQPGELHDPWIRIDREAGRTVHGIALLELANEQQPDRTRTELMGYHVHEIGDALVAGEASDVADHLDVERGQTEALSGVVPVELAREPFGVRPVA